MMLINKQTLSNLMGRLLATDRKQWVVDKSMWIQGEVEIVFETLVEQKWEDALNRAAAELAGWEVSAPKSKMTMYGDMYLYHDTRLHP